jgi:metal-sulfur cluster biosynthetic enzyme
MPPSASSPIPVSRSWWPTAEGPIHYLFTMPTADAIRKAIRAVKDPELNLNIIDIGLVYDVEVGETGEVRVEMTLTSPGCPAGAEIIADVKRVVGDIEGVTAVNVDLVWEPYWTPEKMDPRVRTFLGF